MRAASAQLIALLNSSTAFLMADLYTITLVGGAVLRWTNVDSTLIVSGNTFNVGPLISRGSTRLQAGIEVDSLRVTLSADASVMINGVPLVAFAAAGGLDGARLQLERVFMPAPGDTSAGTILLFGGRVSDVVCKRFEVELEAKSDTELLDVQMPRILYQPACANTLYDSPCALARAAWVINGTAQGVLAGNATVVHALAQATGYFDLGVMTFTSGANNGVSRTVKSYVNAIGNKGITTVRPWPGVVSAGDTFQIVPGCDKTQATCKNKFNNLANFRGFPYVPAPETVT